MSDGLQQVFENPINLNKTILTYDTETSGFRSKSKTHDDPTQAWVVQLGWILSTEERELSTGNFILFPPGNGDIHFKAQETHGISPEDARKFGHPDETLIKVFLHDVMRADLLVCHNRSFDVDFLKDIIARNLSVDAAIDFAELPYYCTMKTEGVMELCGLPWGKSKTRLKWPKLTELYSILFDGETFDGAHDALADVRATRRCYYELKRRGL